MEFFRIFELLIIATFLYVCFRLLKADFKMMKTKIDNELNNKDEKGETKNG